MGNTNSPRLSTKTAAPFVRSLLVKRARLVESLQLGMKRKLSLVIAPAGYGKTTLLGAWLASISRDNWPAAWLTLDSDDNNSSRFWGYVADALNSINPQWQLELSKTEEPPDGGIDRQLLAYWINQIDATPTHFSLILDDFHVIQSEAIHKDLSYFIAHMPQHMHLVLASRTKPQFPVAELRVKNQLVEISLSDMTFSTNECGTFLQEVMKLNLPREEVAVLARATEGWVAGLQMAALSIKNQPDANQWIKHFSGGQGYIFDYLTQAVLDVQGESLQDFLLKTSILTELSAPLCDYLLNENDSQYKLDYLENSNLFITPLSEERVWYRYHALFTDALKTRLERAFPQSVPELHLRAATWLKEKDLPEQAIPHAIAAGCPELAAEIIESCALQTLGRLDVITIRRWISLLPDHLLSHRPLLWIYGAMAENSLGNLEKVETMLRKIKDTLDESSKDERLTKDQAPLYKQISALQAVVDLQSENYAKGIFPAIQAMTDLPESDSLMYGWLNHFLGYAYETSGDLEAAIASFARGKQNALRHKIPTGILSRCEMGRIYKAQGRLREAEREYRQALDFATEASLARELIIFAQLGLSDVLIEQNNFEIVDQWAGEIEPFLPEAKINQYGYLFVIELYACLANYYLIRDLKKSKFFLQKARNELKRTRPFFFFSTITDLRVRIWLADGDLSATYGWVEKRMGKLKHGEELSLVELIGLARIFLVQEEPKAAYPLLEEAEARARKANKGEQLIQTLILKALVLNKLANEEKSMEILTQALTLAEPEGYVRIFIDKGKQLQVLLSKILSVKKQRSDEKYAPPTRSYLEKLLTAFDSSSRIPDWPNSRKSLKPSSLSLLVEPLSKRELEVLVLLKEGNSGSEIAKLLVVSNNTVKVHIRNVYQKLGAHNRKEALERAAEYHILEQ